MPEVDSWKEHGTGGRNWAEDNGVIEWRGDNKPMRTLAPDASPKTPEDIVDADPDVAGLRAEIGTAFEAMASDVHRRFAEMAARISALENRRPDGVDALDARVVALETRQRHEHHNPIASTAPAESSPQGPRADPSSSKGAPGSRTDHGSHGPHTRK